MACSRSSSFDCCQPFWSLQPWVKSPVGKFSLSKFQAVAIKSIPSVKKFDLVLKQPQVVLSKLFHTARLSKYTLPRSCQPRRISWILLPPLPEVQVLLLKSSHLSTLFPFKQVDLPLKSFLRLTKEVKRSRQESQEVWDHLEVSRLKKRSLPVKASGVSPKKIEVEVHHICQEKLASGVKFPKSNHEVSSKSMRPWQWSDKNKRSEGPKTLKWKTRQFGVNVPEVQSWSFLKFQKNEVTKPQQNQTKTKWSVPWLSTRSVLNSYGECCGKIRAVIRVRMKCETIFYTRAVRSQTTLPKGYVIPSDMRCLWSTSFVMYFVITSEGFEVPATFLIETTPEATSSWINRNRSWTCFVFLEVPNLVAIDLPAVLSVWIRIFTFLESWDSRRNDLMNKLSDTPSPMA